MRRKSLLASLDWFTVFLYILLLILGWLSIYAAEYDGTPTGILDMQTNHGKQLVWIMIAIGLGVMLLIIDSKFYTTFAYIIYLFVLLSLIGILFFGTTIKGSKSWFTIGGISMQPAEFAKLATALAIAKYLSGLNVNLKNIKVQLICFLLLVLPSALILFQGDFGSALVFVAFLLVLFREGLSPVYLILVFLLVLLSILALIVNYFYIVASLLLVTGGVAYFFRKNRQPVAPLIGLFILATAYVFTVDYVFENFLEERHRDRINVMLGKSGNDWNVNQAKIAIGSGGWTGKGFLNGTQTKYDFVPELSTDFIFCTIGEEHGFAGTTLVILLFFGFLFRIIYLAERQRSRFSRIFGYSLASVLFFHIAVNIGMTIGLVPVIGIPLPYFSYGGSSLIGFTTFLFILLKLDADRLAVLR
ncbi:MAG: rod shape-determining protein RodA [Chitinophagales bacterium]|nr:MAG: rod shape-determining protein RodA [Chitinophagales bacterium]